LISVKAVVTLVLVERVSIAEAEKAERREPLDRHTYGGPKLVEVGLILDRATQLVGKLNLARIENIADIVEKACARLASEFLRYGDYKLYLIRHQHVAAVRVTEAVFRTHVRLLVSSYGFRPASVKLLVRRQRRG